MHVHKKIAFILFAVFFSMVASAFLAPDYWHMEPETAPTIALEKGMTEQGHPWIGAQDPELTITEFTDYRCFQCKKMHYYLRALVRQNKNTIRLVHKNFPMDSRFNPVVVEEPLHEGSGELALIAIYAGLKGSFWKMNDVIFELPRNIKSFDLREIAKRAGMSADELAAAVRSVKIKKILQRDIWEGMKLRITGTPSYVIQGRVFEGNIPASVLEPYVRE